MYKVLCCSILAVFLVSLCGCGASGDALAKQRIADLNELADAFESGAEEAKIDEISERMEKTGKAFDELGLSDAQKKELDEKYATEMIKALARVTKAGMAQRQEKMKGMMPGMPNMPDMSKMPAIPEAP